MSLLDGEGEREEDGDRETGLFSLFFLFFKD